MARTVRVEEKDVPLEQRRAQLIHSAQVVAAKLYRLDRKPTDPDVPKPKDLRKKIGSAVADDYLHRLGDMLAELAARERIAQENEGVPVVGGVGWITDALDHSFTHLPYPEVTGGDTASGSFVVSVVGAEENFIEASIGLRIAHIYVAISSDDDASAFLRAAAVAAHWYAQRKKEGASSL